MMKGKKFNKYLKTVKSIKKKKGMYITKDKVLFRYTKDAKKIQIPRGIKRIGHGVFAGSKKLKSVKLSKTVREIGEKAFNSCKKLKTVSFNKKLKKIESNAFSWTNLKKVILPNSVTSIGEYGFAFCPIRKLKISNKIKKILNETFTDLRVSELVIPGSVKTIGRYAFEGSNMTKLTLKEGVEVIEEHAFDEVGDIRVVEFPKSLKKADSMAFPETEVGQLTMKNMSIEAQYAFNKVGALCCVTEPKNYQIFAEKSLNYNDILEIFVSKVIGASGIQIQYSKNADYSDAVTKNVANMRKTHNLKVKDTVYKYARVRPYTVEKNITTYGKWSVIYY